MFPKKPITVIENCILSMIIWYLSVSELIVSFVSKYLAVIFRMLNIIVTTTYPTFAKALC